MPEPGSIQQPQPQIPLWTPTVPPPRPPPGPPPGAGLKFIPLKSTETAIAPVIVPVSPKTGRAPDGPARSTMKETTAPRPTKTLDKLEMNKRIATLDAQIADINAPKGSWGKKLVFALLSAAAGFLAAAAGIAFPPLGIALGVMAGCMLINKLWEGANAYGNEQNAKMAFIETLEKDFGPQYTKNAPGILHSNAEAMADVESRLQGFRKLSKTEQLHVAKFGTKGPSKSGAKINKEPSRPPLNPKKLVDKFLGQGPHALESAYARDPGAIEMIAPKLKPKSAG